MRQIGCRVSEELFAAIELARGDVPRERWMRLAFVQRIARGARPEDLPELRRALMERQVDFAMTSEVMEGAEPVLVDLDALP